MASEIGKRMQFHDDPCFYHLQFTLYNSALLLVDLLQEHFDLLAGFDAVVQDK